MKPQWPDARGWIGIGVFAISIMLLWMMKEDRSLREDEFFQTIATVIISNGLVGGLIAWAYASTKNGGELAEKNATIVHESATATAALASSAATGPQQVEVVNPPENPANVIEAVPHPTPWPDEELPEYAR